MIFDPSEDGNCPQCGSSWRGGQIPSESVSKGYYGHHNPCKKLREWDKGYDELTQCTCPVRHYSRLIGIEVPSKYDGVSYWRCPDCGATWDRWTGAIVTENADRRI